MAQRQQPIGGQRPGCQQGGRTTVAQRDQSAELAAGNPTHLGQPQGRSSKRRSGPAQPARLGVGRELDKLLCQQPPQLFQRRKSRAAGQVGPAPINCQQSAFEQFVNGLKFCHIRRCVGGQGAVLQQNNTGFQYSTNSPPLHTRQNLPFRQAGEQTGGQPPADLQHSPLMPLEARAPPLQRPAAAGQRRHPGPAARCCAASPAGAAIPVPPAARSQPRLAGCGWP